MASHPEQLRIQIQDAIDVGLSCALANYQDRDDFDIDLVDVVAGKGSSHYIAVFRFEGDPSFSSHEKYTILGELRPEILDEVASSTNRKRIPNITFKISPEEINFEA